MSQVDLCSGGFVSSLLRAGGWTLGRVTELLGAKGSQACLLLPPHCTRAQWQAVSEGGVWLPTVDTDFLCHLQWEKSQLDEEFMHSVENVCGCAKYECGEWEGADVGELGWAGGWALQDRSLPLPHPVKAPVCLSRELGVMQPGQTVVELSADGVCHTSRCTDVLDPLTNFYQINITSVLCDMHCEAVGTAWSVCLLESWDGRASAGYCQLQKASLESRHQRPPS